MAVKKRKEPLVRKKKRDNIMGCPKIKIDWNIFESCCKVLATERELCNLLGVNKDTLIKRIKERYGKSFEQVRDGLCDITKVSLRRSQIKKAIEEKNVVMQIWLGKQYLGQTEKVVQADGNLNDEKFRDEFFGLKS